MFDLTVLENLLYRLNQAVLLKDLAREAAEVTGVACNVPLAVALIRGCSGQLNIAAAGMAKNKVVDMEQFDNLLPDEPFSGPLTQTGWGSTLKNAGLESVTMFPLTVKGESLGYLLAFSMDRTPPDTKVMQFFSVQVSVAVQRCRQYSQERQTFHQLQKVKTDLLHQQQEKERFLELQRQFADPSLLANGFEPLVEKLGECFNTPLFLLDKSLRLLAAYTPDVRLEGPWIRTLEEGRLVPELAGQSTLQGAVRALLGGESCAVSLGRVSDSPGSVYWLAPLKSGNATWGFLFWRGTPPPLALEAERTLELASMSITMAYYQQCLEAVSPSISFIEPLLTGQYVSAEAIEETAGRLGCELKRVTRILLGEAGTGSVNLSELQAAAETAASGFGPGVYTAVYNGSVVLLLENGIDAKSLAKAVQERLRAASGGTLTFGISRFLRDLSDIRAGYDELRRSLAIFQSLGKTKSVVAFDELGVYRVLLSVDRSILEEITQRVLGPLLKETQKAELLSTLTSYIRSGGSQQKAAEECFVHLNTVKYRLKKMAQLLKIDICNPEERFELDFALRALEVLDL
ncbi:MAG: Purine catabolism regulatory protein [Pelotomaculum sp. PtaU1.Bin035]|nr:MAG: Purine catabolism regulatory protein [Pelotomaculum sp. PtaU1.Bin035]